MKTIQQCEQIDILFKHQCVYTNVLIDQFACGHDKKKIMAAKEFLYVIKIHVDLQKPLP